MTASEKLSSTSIKWQDKHLAPVSHPFFPYWMGPVILEILFSLLTRRDTKPHTFMKWIYALLKYILSYPEQDTSKVLQPPFGEKKKTKTTTSKQTENKTIPESNFLDNFFEG